MKGKNKTLEENRVVPGTSAIRSLWSSLEPSMRRCSSSCLPSLCVFLLILTAEIKLAHLYQVSLPLYQLAVASRGWSGTDHSHRGISENLAKSWEIDYVHTEHLLWSQF